MRSQSGSVATTRSASFFSASSTPSRSAAAFSGFGDSTVGKFPSKRSCSWTTRKIETETLEHRLDDDAAGPVKRREDNAQIFRGSNEFACPGSSFRAAPCRLHRFRARASAPRLARSAGLRVGFAGDSVHFRDDSAGVRLDDLRAVVEVSFESVIVRRIVAGGDDDARARAQITNGERQFRGRPRPVEDRGIAAIFGRGLRDQVGEFFRENAECRTRSRSWVLPAIFCWARHSCR